MIELRWHFYTGKEFAEMKKWICSLILTAAVMLTLGIAAGADEAISGILSGDFMYMVNDDKVSVTITEYLGDGGDVVIPETLEGYTVTAIGESAF
ncbi:MAG: hypothetical protein J6I42_11605, partial [Clostridia bacterium]|nr:hypothetical protein [Clostridia bacterium]